MSWGRNFRPRSSVGDDQPRGRPISYDYGRSRLPPVQRVPVEEDKEEEESEDDDDEIIPLPEELTHKFGKLTCELCHCTLQTVTQANMHYEGKQHEKRVMRYLEEWSRRMKQKIPNYWLKIVCKRKKNKLRAGSSEKFCNVCNIVLTSPVVAEQHYAGRAHNAALKLNKGKHPTKDVQSPARSVFMCNICNIVTSCQEHLENHMRGSKHKKVLQQLKEAESLEMCGGRDEGKKEDDKEVPEYNVIQSLSGDVQYECVYCTWRGPPFEYEAHKEKPTHVAAIEEESKVNTDLDDDDEDDEDADETEYTDVTDLFCKLCNVQLTSKKEVAHHVKSRDHREEVNLRKKQVLLSMDDPEKIVVKEEHNCDLCVMKFPSKSMYDAHLQWKRHVKKLANKVQSESRKKCELCDLEFFSEKLYNAHLNTKRHRSNEQWLKNKQSKTDKGSDANVDDDKGKKTDNKKHTKSEYSVSNGTEKTKTLEKPSEIEVHFEKSSNSCTESKNDSSYHKSHTCAELKDDVSNDKLSDKADNNKAAAKEARDENAVFECEVCEISISGKLPYEQHLISTRHFLQCSLKQATGSASATEQNASANTNKPFFCKLCHATSLTKYQHELHVNSKKHKEAVTKLEVKKFEPKLKTAGNFKPVVSKQNTLTVERTQNFHGNENISTSGKYENWDDFKQYENTVGNKSVNQLADSQEPHVGLHSSRDMPNIQPSGIAPRSFGQNLSSEVRFAVPQPTVLPPGAPSSYFPPTSSVERFPLPPLAAAPVIKNTQDVGRMEAGSYSDKITTDPPPIRKAIYSCKECGATFISGVDYKQHVSICKARVGFEERKAAPCKTSQNDLYHCEACDEKCVSYREFLEHTASAEHEANIEHLRDFGKRLKPAHKETLKHETVTFKREMQYSSSSPEREQRKSLTWRSRSPEQREKLDLHHKHSKNFKSNSSSESCDSDEVDLSPQKRLKQQFKCKPCNKFYSLEQEYKDHLKSKRHKSKMCLYECSDCSEVFSSKHGLASHSCNIGVGIIRSIEESDSGKRLQNWGFQYGVDKCRKVHLHQSSSIYEKDDAGQEVDDNEEVSQNLLSFQKFSKESLLPTFSFKRETHNLMSNSPGWSGFND